MALMLPNSGIGTGLVLKVKPTKRESWVKVVLEFDEKHKGK
jgi:hypothetical protein